MSADGPSIPSRAVPFEGTASSSSPASAPGWTWLALLLAAAGLGSSALLWSKVSNMQELLAQQALQAQTQSLEARTLAQGTQDLLQTANTRLGVVEARVAEVSLQRGQLEELVRSLSRSREDTLALDLEAAMRLAVQQAQLTGSTAPLIASLKSASKRIENAAQPSLALAQRAMERDVERLRAAPVADTMGLLTRLDEALRLLDDLPLHNGAPQPASAKPKAAAQKPAAAKNQATPAEAAATEEAAQDDNSAWWRAGSRQLWHSVQAQAGELLRVSLIPSPEAALLSPEQGFFLRQNLKLQLLNARLAILGRQNSAAITDLAAAQASIGHYFVPSATRTQTVQTILAQLQAQLRSSVQPNIEDTLTALANATAQRE